MAGGKVTKANPFWAIVITLLIIVGAIVLFSDVFTGSTQTETKPNPSSLELTTKPEEGVEVDLPDTPLRTVPIEEASSEDADGAEEQ